MPGPSRSRALCREASHRSSLLLVGGHHLLDLSDGFPRVQALGAGPRAVHDGVAAVQREGVLQLGQALLREVVSGVDHPAVGLHEHGGPQVLVPVPPVAGAAGAAAGTEDALVQAVQFLPLLDGLQVLLLAPCDSSFFFK